MPCLYLCNIVDTMCFYTYYLVFYDDFFITVFKKYVILLIHTLMERQAV